MPFSFSPGPITFFASMIPFLELRAALPWAIIQTDLSLASAFLWAVAGNVTIALILLLALNKTQQILTRHSKFFKNFFHKLFQRTYFRHKEKFELIEDLALIFIVAIPLPFTGAWTGSLAAYVFQVPLKKAFPLITIGVIIAGILVTFLTKAGLAWWIAA